MIALHVLTFDTFEVYHKSKWLWILKDNSVLEFILAKNNVLCTLWSVTEKKKPIGLQKFYFFKVCQTICLRILTLLFKKTVMIFILSKNVFNSRCRSPFNGYFYLVEYLVLNLKSLVLRTYSTLATNLVCSVKFN